MAPQYIGCVSVIGWIEVWDAPRHLLAKPPNRIGPQDILLLGPSDWYGVLRARAILMPYLSDCMGCDVGVMMHASWVVRRPHLKGDN